MCFILHEFNIYFACILEIDFTKVSNLGHLLTFYIST